MGFTDDTNKILWFPCTMEHHCSPSTRLSSILNRFRQRFDVCLFMDMYIWCGCQRRSVRWQFCWFWFAHSFLSLFCSPSLIGGTLYSVHCGAGKSPLTSLCSQMFPFAVHTLTQGQKPIVKEHIETIKAHMHNHTVPFLFLHSVTFVWYVHSELSFCIKSDFYTSITNH